jgi:ATP-dependent Clp protease protease subunit
MAQHKITKYWNMQPTGNNAADVYIFGEIATSGYEWSDSDVSASSFKADLDSLGTLNTINLHLNSPGGSVFDGTAIGTMLSQHPAYVNVYIDGLAASIASVIAMAGDTVYMPANAMMMIHNPWTMAVGNANDMRKQADVLDKIGESMKQTYLQKAGDKLDDKTLSTLLDNETWLSAQDAVNYGFADEILPVNQAAAAIVSKDLFAKYRNVPENLQLHKEKTENSVNNPVKEPINKVNEEPVTKPIENNLTLKQIKLQILKESN